MGKKQTTGISRTMEDGKIVWAGPGKTGLIRVIFDPETAPAVLRHRAMLEGFGITGDRVTAMSRNEENGQSASIEDKLAKLQRRIDMAWALGVWSVDRAFAAKRGPDSRTIIMAMIRALAGVNTADEAEAILTKTINAKKAANRDEALALWAKSKQVAEAIKLIEAERAAANATQDSDDLLAELEAFEEDDEAPM